MIVTRFAPSPTGFIHLGNIRSAFSRNEVPVADRTVLLNTDYFDKLSNDPKFAEKVVDIVGLYLNPPDLKKSALDIKDFIRKAVAN